MIRRTSVSTHVFDYALWIKNVLRLIRISMRYTRERPGGRIHSCISRRGVGVLGSGDQGFDILSESCIPFVLWQPVISVLSTEIHETCLFHSNSMDFVFRVWSRSSDACSRLNVLGRSRWAAGNPGRSPLRRGSRGSDLVQLCPDSCCQTTGRGKPKAVCILCSYAVHCEFENQHP